MPETVIVPLRVQYKSTPGLRTRSNCKFVACLLNVIFLDKNFSAAQFQSAAASFWLSVGDDDRIDLAVLPGPPQEGAKIPNHDDRPRVAWNLNLLDGSVDRF